MKYSKQREEILKIVNMSNKHPTAEMIYREVRKKVPNISLGTVYRNLKLMVENGSIKNIKGLDLKEHFDKSTFEHGHLLCIECKEIYDIDNKFIKVLKENLENEPYFQFEIQNFTITGICPKCKK